jgi:hypothetical protein
LGKLQRSVYRPHPPPPSLQRDYPHPPTRDTHMGSRVLLSQDLSASKFSMIILDTIHSGPEARHTPARPGRGRYSRRCPRPLLRAPPAWAAVGGAGGRFPRALNSEQLRGDSRRPRVHGVPGASPPPRPRPRREQQRFARALPLFYSPANLPETQNAVGPLFLSASGLGVCWQRSRGKSK